MVKTKEQTIQELGSKFDPRSAKWENKAILDTLQEEPDGLNATDICAAINEKYECDLFTYHPLYKNLQNLVQQDIIRYNGLNKRYYMNPEYITFEVKFLPLSNYCVWLFSISVLVLMASIYVKNTSMVNTSVGIVSIGALYLFGQYMGSEFKLNGSINNILSKIIRK